MAPRNKKASKDKSASEQKLHDTQQPSTSGAAGGNKQQKTEQKYNDPEYLERRRRNNDAVHKSREKKRKQEAEAMQRVSELKAENDELERKVDGLNQELQFLKDMFVQMASGKGKGSGKKS